MNFKQRIKKNKVLESEPYSSFIKQFNKESNNEIHLRISADSDNTECFKIDSIYARFFDMSFKFYMLMEGKTYRIPRFYVKHSISFGFIDDDYTNMMLQMIEDIKKRSDYFYISSLAEKCRIESTVNKNLVTVTYYVSCKRKHAEEICLQLISHDIAMFARGF